MHEKHWKLRQDTLDFGVLPQWRQLWETLRDVVKTALFVQPVIDPCQRSDASLVQPVVPQRNHVQTLALIESCL